MGILSFVLGGLLIMGYMALTPDDPHRRILMTLDIVTILGSVFVVGPIGTRSLGAPWRETFFFAWSVGTMVVIAGWTAGRGALWPDCWFFQFCLAAFSTDCARSSAWLCWPS
jgi:hypothetical protein